MKSMRLVIAAEHPGVREAAAHHLAAWGGAVVASCANPAELLAALETASADLIFADDSISSHFAKRAEGIRVAGVLVLALDWIFPNAAPPGADANEDAFARHGRRELSGVRESLLGLIEDVDRQKRVAAQAEARLAAQREALVREIHHRIKNNLQAVAGMLRRQLGLHPDLSETLEAAISQVNTMAIVHGLQGRSEGETVRFKDLLAGVGVAAEKVLDRVLLLPPLAGLSGIEVSGEETVPVAMVLNELLLNALKHGCYGAESTPARLSIERHEDRVLLRIENTFDDPGGPLAYAGRSNGGGLKLVQAMLPVQGATLNWHRKAPGLVVTELMLSPPVLRFAAADGTKKET